ncbi:interferon-activable protein 205-B-like [Microtus ochrogaster]|uniref:Interferon-activable protein 205-B-like n=1 Tax=Microtus ochrogaster TaxID=79684 RepID=A0ABM1AWM9_MICOH|nr:interferon-activable protein 205-B-like [Microtus ochrogaster]
MVNEYKRIVLLNGLANISSDQFDCFKLLMSSDLRLERNMQEKYTKGQIADMMEDEFPTDAGLSKLIYFCENIQTLKGLAETLKEEKSKVKGKTPLRNKNQEAGSSIKAPTASNTSASDGGKTSSAQKRKSMNNEKTAMKKVKGSERPNHPPCSTESTARCQSSVFKTSSLASFNTSLDKNQKTQTQNQSTARGAVCKNDAMIVIVLKATEPFVYKSTEPGGKMMFHATVATEREYFHVKVFNINLKKKFTRENVIMISNYLEFKGILEINEDSSVLEAGSVQNIKVPTSIIKKSKETPKIFDIRKYATGTLVYGLFTLHKIKVNPKNTIYEMKDATGNIEVLGSKQCYNIRCKEGDKLRLFCFQVKTIDKQPKLVSGDHSFIKKKSRKTSVATEEDTLPETMSQLNIASASSTHPADDQDQTAPNHSPDLAESLPTPAPGLATQTPNQSTNIGAVGQNEAMIVMVLDASEPLEYVSKEKVIKKMFHATVATVTEYFNLKVFNIHLREKFTKSNIIKIANYIKDEGILVINENSSVTEAGPDEVIEVPNRLIRRAEETLMISDINKIVSKAPFYGSFTLNKKVVKQTKTFYEMRDDTGNIEVVGSGRCFDIKCKEGDILQFFDFKMTTTNHQAKLESGEHSFIKKKSRKTSVATEEDTLPETMSQLNIASASSTHPADDQDQTAPNHSPDLAESLPTPAPGLAVSQPQILFWNPPNSPSHSSSSVMISCFLYDIFMI